MYFINCLSFFFSDFLGKIVVCFATVFFAFWNQSNSHTSLPLYLYHSLTKKECILAFPNGVSAKVNKAETELWYDLLQCYHSLDIITYISDRRHRNLYQLNSPEQFHVELMSFGNIHLPGIQLLLLPEKKPKAVFISVIRHTIFLVPIIILQSNNAKSVSR